MRTIKCWNCAKIFVVFSMNVSVPLYLVHKTSVWFLFTEQNYERAKWCILFSAERKSIGHHMRNANNKTYRIIRSYKINCVRVVVIGWTIFYLFEYFDCVHITEEILEPSEPLDRPPWPMWEPLLPRIRFDDLRRKTWFRGDFESFQLHAGPQIEHQKYYGSIFRYHFYDIVHIYSKLLFGILHRDCKNKWCIFHSFHIQFISKFNKKKSTTQYSRPWTTVARISF